MFEPPETMVINTLKSSALSSKSRNFAVHQNNDSSSSGLDHSSSESDDDNVSNNDVSIMDENKCEGKEGKLTTTMNKTATSDMKKNKIPSQRKTAKNVPPSAPDSSPL